MPDTPEPQQSEAEEQPGQLWIFNATAEAEVIKAADADEGQET